MHGIITASSMLLAMSVLAANILAGAFIFVQNRKSPVNRMFGFLAALTGLWAFSLSVFIMNGEMIWGRWTYAFASFIPPLFLIFVKVFPRLEERINASDLTALFAGGVFSFLSFSDLVISSVERAEWGATFELGPFYPLFALYFVTVLITAFSKLYRKFRGSYGISRVQIMYVMLGTGLSTGIAVTVAIILPNFGFPRLYFLAPPATFIMIGFIAYSIAKHRLMSIEIVIRQGTIYTAAMVLIASFYALAVVLSEGMFRGLLGYSSAYVTGLAAILIAVAYQPLVRSFQKVADRLFFRGSYDYQKTLNRISHEIASVIKLEDLTSLIVSSIVETMKMSEISFILPAREGNRYHSAPCAAPRYKKMQIDATSPIISWILLNKDILVRDEIEGLSTPGIDEVKEEMERLGILVWVPIVFKDEVVGMLALGKKLSDDIYTSEDMTLLTTLANQAAVALDNARLYDEVLTMKNYNQEILDSMASGVITADARGRIITFNPMAEKITGILSGEAIGRGYREVFSPKSPLVQVLDGCLKNRCFSNFEASIVSSSRGLVPVSLNSNVLKDSHGRVTGALVAISDLTEVKALEGKVRQADKIGALGTMAAGMAHEIKNPLSSMKVLSQLIPIKYGDPDFRNKFIEIMPREITRIDRIVESLLGFARATSPKFLEVDTRKLLEDDVKYFRDQADKAQVKIVENYAELPSIEGDPDQLSQVFSNLMLNAIQAMHDGGELRITTREGKKIENILQKVEIEISDTGHGISPENLKKLFDPFFTTKYAGTGLGLTISHSVIDGHRGTIDVRSEAGKGTSFLITLPVKQELI